MVFGIVAALSLLAAIAIHELGHYFAARRLGMRVDQYFIGFGPKLWSRRVGATEVGVRAFPLGGFVKIPGMDLSNNDDPEPGTYAARPWYAQIAVALAGPITHFAIAFVVLTLAFGLSSPDPFDGLPGVSAVTADSPAAVAGLTPRDIVVSVDGVDVATWDEVGVVVRQRQSPRVTVLRDGASVVLDVANWNGVIIPRTSPTRGGPLAALSSGASGVADLTGVTIAGVADVFLNVGDLVGAATGAGPIPAERPVSLIGVVDISGDAGSAFGWFGVAFMVAQINIGLGLMNLLPIYPFDGGHILGAVVNRILRRRKVRRPALRALAALTVPAVAALLMLFVVSSVVDVRALA